MLSTDILFPLTAETRKVLAPLNGSFGGQSVLLKLEGEGEDTFSLPTLKSLHHYRKFNRKTQ